MVKDLLSRADDRGSTPGGEIKFIFLFFFCFLFLFELDISKVMYCFFSRLKSFTF